MSIPRSVREGKKELTGCSTKLQSTSCPARHAVELAEERKPATGSRSLKSLLMGEERRVRRRAELARQARRGESQGARWGRSERSEFEAGGSPKGSRCIGPARSALARLSFASRYSAGLLEFSSKLNRRSWHPSSPSRRTNPHSFSGCSCPKISHRSESYVYGFTPAQGAPKDRTHNLKPARLARSTAVCALTPALQ